LVLKYAVNTTIEKDNSNMLFQPEQLLKEVVDTQYFAVLNTVGEGQPYSNLVAFAITEDLKSLFFITERNTRKYRNIKANNSISLLIDNRTNRPSDISQAVAITVIGKAVEELNDNGKLRAIFLKKHPQLQQFIDNPNSALVLVTVSEYVIASFDKTHRLAMSQ